MLSRSSVEAAQDNETVLPRRFWEDLRSAYRLLDGEQRLSFIWLTGVRVTVGFCDLLLAFAMYLVFLLLQGGSPAHRLWWSPKTSLAAAILASVLVVLRSLMDIASMRAVVSYVQGLNTGLLLRLTQGYSQMEWSRFVECNRSELLNHSMYTAREAANFFQYAIELIASIAVVAAMTIALIYQSPEVACGLCVAIVMFYGVHRLLIRNRLQAAGAERERSARLLQRSLADIFSSGKEIRTYRNHTMYDRVRELAGRVATSSLRIALLPQIARILADQGVVLIFLGIVVAVQVRHGDTRHLLSILVFYFVISRRLLPLISQISFLAGQVDGSYENVHIVGDELDKCSQYRAPEPPIHLPHAAFVLEVEAVSFSFEASVPILRDVSFRQRKGETIVLCGASGSGKSSLLNLVAGITAPVSGRICVDRGSIAYVPQETALLDDSIRNNLLFGLADRSDTELINALAVANLADFVTAQPMGLSTRVGDNGILFSGGQRQRLGLARAIVRGVNLLLLDEATSGLDPESEWQVLENLTATGVAVLLVTHRIPLHFIAQRVLRLKDGVLMEGRNHSMPVSVEHAAAAR
jgi:ABC-type bacteriocin/lantibiotic exporter with double-glycine peptidase domain